MSCEIHRKKHLCSLDKTQISWNIPAAGVLKVLSYKVSAFFINREIAIQIRKDVSNQLDGVSPVASSVGAL
jgi:hypothetical protein